MRVLVTGASGFIGRHIAEHAVAAGHRVRAVVLPGEDTSLLDEWSVEVVVGDLVDPGCRPRGGRLCGHLQHAAWFDRVILSRAREAVALSAERYLRAIGG